MVFYRRIFTLVLVFHTILVSGQDVHFSQYFNNPLFINPAHAGNGINYVRASVFYRNQWNSVASPFSSQSIAVDKAVNRFGFGALFTNNSAGGDGIKQMNILGNLTYIQPLDADKINKVAIGVQFGIMQKSFDPSKMTFDNQYSVDHGFDPNASNGEIFANTTINRPDINAGILYTRNIGVADKKFKPFAGISVHHLTQPRESFIIDENKLPLKFTANAGAGLALGHQLELRPSCLFVKQENFSELNFGMLASFSLENLNVLQLGIYNRHRDAVIAYAGYQVSNFFLGVSYDINTSALSGATKSMGGFEISLTYVPKGKIRKSPDKVKAKNEFSDRDGDTVEDRKDECPDLFGEIASKGCPDDDRDRDGIADKHDKCPDLHGTKMLKGCPDRDQDGIEDAEDHCPDQAGPESSHGCPLSDIDADGDGIPDKIDECPFIKGTIATRGCPDTDKDGIADTEDECPFIKGDKSHNGCPDPESADAKTTSKKLEHINFETNLAVIDLKYFDIVEHAIDMLSENKNTSIVLSGHTDSEGDARYNMVLSQSRTDAVKEYLITHGVNEKRISTVAYGETKPITENGSPEEKFRNRRVEINMITENKK